MRHCVMMFQPSSDLLGLTTAVTRHTCTRGCHRFTLARHLHQRRRVCDLHEINAWVVLRTK
jgi:hypothetical protein